MPHADWSLGDQDWFSLLSWQVISMYFSYRTSFCRRWLWYKVKGLSQKNAQVCWLEWTPCYTHLSMVWKWPCCGRFILRKAPPPWKFGPRAPIISYKFGPKILSATFFRHPVYSYDFLMEGSGPGRHVAVPVQRAPVQHDRARERHLQICEHSLPGRNSYRTLLWQDRVCIEIRVEVLPTPRISIIRCSVLYRWVLMQNFQLWRKF